MYCTAQDDVFVLIENSQLVCRFSHILVAYKNTVCHTITG